MSRTEKLIDKVKALLDEELSKKEPATVEEIVDLVRHSADIDTTALVKALIKQCSVDQADILRVMDTDELKTWAENNYYISTDAPISDFMNLQDFSDVKNWIDCDYPDFDDNREYEFRVKPEEQKPRRMTYRQLAEWLAKENGQYTPLLSKTYVSSAMDYDNTLDNNELPEGYVVRRWDSDEWIEPTEDIYEQDCKDVRVNKEE